MLIVLVMRDLARFSVQEYVRCNGMNRSEREIRAVCTQLCSDTEHCYLLFC